MPPVLSFDQVADLAYAVGLRGNALGVAVAIAKAESGLDVTARGDVSLVTEKWGPSIGLWQVRSVNAERGKGTERDELALYSPSHNARSMYGISGGGTNWRPWSVYNLGLYRTHLAEAQAAAGRREASGGSGGSVSGGGGVTEDDAPDLGTSPDVIIPPRTLPLAYTPPRRVDDVRLEGASSSVNLGDAVLGGRVELTSQEASEVTLELVNTGRRLWGMGRGIVATGARFDWSGLGEFRVAVVDAGDNGGVDTVTIAARPEAIHALKQPTMDAGVLSGKDISPTEWLQRRLRLAAPGRALRFMGQGSPRRTDIAPVEQGDGTLETAWQVAQRLAKELGYWLFEAAGVLYFGQPKWLAGLGTELKVALVAGAWGDARLDPVGRPAVRKSLDSEEGATLEVQLPRWRGEQARPGMRIASKGLYGVPQRWLVTRVSWPVDGGSAPVTVEAAEPVNPKPQPPGGTSAGDGSGSSSSGSTPSSSGSTPATQSGTGSALDFVTECLRQTGDAYVFGAEANPTDADPDAFDCSELVQWAAARVGVTIADGAYNQWKACTAISIDQAKRTRGALLFVGDGTGSGRDAITHVAVSLGDGSNTIEARGRAYGVVQAPIAGRFDYAGLIPGMRYA